MDSSLDLLKMAVYFKRKSYKLPRFCASTKSQNLKNLQNLPARFCDSQNLVLFFAKITLFLSNFKG